MIVHSYLTSRNERSFIHAKIFKTDLSMRKLAYHSALVLTATAFLAGCGDQNAAPQQGQMPPASVSAMEVKSENVTITRELPGRTVAFMMAEVRPQVSGIIKERLFEEGSTVEAGQPLYQLDDATYTANYNMAKANLEAAKASLSIAQTEAERSKSLLESKAVSKQEYDTDQAALQQAEAQLAVAEASLASSKVDYDRSRVTSPLTGKIGRSSVTQGALVTANQSDPLAQITQLDPMYVDIAQSSSELLRTRRAIAQGELLGVEMPVTILLEDGSTYEHTGKIAFSEVNVDTSTGSYTLRVVVPNPDELLLPGMYVRAVIGEGIRENGILVPQSAVSRTPTGATVVMVVGADGTANSRVIETSQSIGNKWLVKSGLVAGDKIITNGLQKVRPGAKVNVVPNPASAETAH